MLAELFKHLGYAYDLLSIKYMLKKLKWCSNIKFSAQNWQPTSGVTKKSTTPFELQYRVTLWPVWLESNNSATFT